jgi:hypothetical protein
LCFKTITESLKNITHHLFPCRRCTGTSGSCFQGIASTLCRALHSPRRCDSPRKVGSGRSRVERSIE